MTSLNPTCRVAVLAPSALCSNVNCRDIYPYTNFITLQLERWVDIAQAKSTYTVEPLYRGNHWDPAGCPVYSGTYIEDTIGTQLNVLYTVEPLYRGHYWDPAGCPVYSGTSL